MARLYRLSGETALNSGAELLLDHLQLAESFWARGKGLLGKKALIEGEGLWINPCNNIHTWFMSMKIDCIFVDRRLCIYKIVQDIPSFRFVGPYWKAISVFEVAAGFSERKKLNVGDQLYVVN